MFGLWQATLGSGSRILGVDFMCLGGELGALWVVIKLLKVDFMNLKVEFRLLEVEI